MSATQQEDLRPITLFGVAPDAETLAGGASHETPDRILLLVLAKLSLSFRLPLYFQVADGHRFDVAQYVS